MYLSKLELNSGAGCRALLRDLASPYEMHRTILRAFPSADAGGPGRVLFRVEPTRPGDPVVLVQSDKPPDWSALAGIPGYLSTPPEPAKELVLALRPGQRLCFRLRANPTVKREGKRLGLLDAAAQQQWLLRKGSAGGFRPVDFVTCRAGRRVSPPAGAAHLRQQTHFSVDFEGILEVTDPQCFTQTIAAGIGSAKAFGFGMLSVAPVRA
jgi:CRISPR system Cascade subunit CasE